MVLALLLLAGLVRADSQWERTLPVRLTVGFHEAPSSVEGVQAYGARVLGMHRGARLAVVEASDPDAFHRRALHDPNIRYVEPDATVNLLGATTLASSRGGTASGDPFFADQYGPQQVRAPQAWRTTQGNTSASVCLVDTGIRYTHEDLMGPRWLGGYDFVNNDADPWDDNGHGTHVASIAAASIGNGRGIAGIANVGLYAVKVLDGAGFGTWGNVALGILWCADHAGPRGIVNLSLAGTGFNSAVADAADYAYRLRGLLLVAAAGNAGPCNDCVRFPAKLPETIAVACTARVGFPAVSHPGCSFSSSGPEVELAAPGTDILGAWSSNDTAYEFSTGTSMSTPHVSGAAALVWSHRTELKATELRQRLRDTAQDAGDLGWDARSGFGEVDVKCLLEGWNPCLDLFS